MLPQHSKISARFNNTVRVETYTFRRDFSHKTTTLNIFCSLLTFLSHSCWTYYARIGIHIALKRDELKQLKTRKSYYFPVFSSSFVISFGSGCFLMVCTRPRFKQWIFVVLFENLHGDCSSDEQKSIVKV